METKIKQETFKTTNPANGKELSSYTYMTDDQVESTVTIARSFSKMENEIL